MNLIDVQPNDFMFMYGITLTDLKKFKIILDNMEFKYDGTIPEHEEAKDYLETELYPAIKQGLKAVEDKDGTKPNS